MAADFSELLSANRMRTLWGAGKPRAAITPRPADAESAPEDATSDAPEDATIEPQPQESSDQILEKLEGLLSTKLGARARLLTGYLRPLRKAISDGDARLPALIYSLEDVLRGLLRTCERTEP